MLYVLTCPHLCKSSRDTTTGLGRRLSRAPNSTPGRRLCLFAEFPTAPIIFEHHLIPSPSYFGPLHKAGYAHIYPPVWHYLAWSQMNLDMGQKVARMSTIMGLSCSQRERSQSIWKFQDAEYMGRKLAPLLAIKDIAA